jgi:hypothetical protein
MEMSSINLAGENWEIYPDVPCGRSSRCCSLFMGSWVSPLCNGLWLRECQAVYCELE